MKGMTVSSMTDTDTAVSIEVYLGVDTHRDTHHAALVDRLGRPIDDREFPTTTDGYRRLLTWASAAGAIVGVGVEGTSSYGAALTGVLREAGLAVVEVDHPDRSARRRRGKSDPVDAYAAAAAVVSGRATTCPKSRDGDVESIRVLHNTRRAAVKARSDALTSLKSMLVTAPDEVRERLRGLTRARLIRVCAGLEPGPVASGGVSAATETALRSIAVRYQHLSVEIAALERDLRVLTRRAAPALLELPGVGFDTTAQLLITVGDNRERIVSEAALANLCGVAPIQASSGQRCRHRLNRGGDRQANRALHTVVLSRLKTDPVTRAYRERRLAEGKTKREVIRCLKRAVAREIFRVLNPRAEVDDS